MPAGQKCACAKQCEPLVQLKDWRKIQNSCERNFIILTLAETISYHMNSIIVKTR